MSDTCKRCGREYGVKYTMVTEEYKSAIIASGWSFKDLCPDCEYELWEQHQAKESGVNE